MLTKETTRETKLGDTFSTGNVQRMDKRRERHKEKLRELQDHVEVG
jgi:hypothetical protein